MRAQTVRIKERIDAQVQTAQRQRRYNDQPLTGQLLVLWNLSKVMAKKIGGQILSIGTHEFSGVVK